MKPALRLGVIGVGAIAQVAQLPVLARLRGAQLVALCDNDGPKARALAERFGVPDVFTDIEELLEFDELDAVVICDAQPSARAARAERARGRGARALRAAARADRARRRAHPRRRGARDRKVRVANNHRFRADVQALAAFLRGGELGKLTGVRTGSYQRSARPRDGAAPRGGGRRRVLGARASAARSRALAGRLSGAGARQRAHGARARGERGRGLDARLRRVRSRDR